MVKPLKEIQKERNSDVKPKYGQADTTGSRFGDKDKMKKNDGRVTFSGAVRKDN